MIKTQNIDREAQRSLNGILSSVEGTPGSKMEKDQPSWMQFCTRKLDKCSEWVSVLQV